jgi:hypothetical protein
MDWIRLTQDKQMWQAIVITVITPGVQLNAGTSQLAEKYQLIKKVSALGRSYSVCVKCQFSGTWKTAQFIQLDNYKCSNSICSALLYK